MGTQIGCHESTQIVDSTDQDNTDQNFSPSDTQQNFAQYKIYIYGGLYNVKF